VLLAVVAGLLLCSNTVAFGGKPVTFFGLTVPDQVQGATRGETTDFETTRPGLGYSAVYWHRDWTANMYVYDLGRESISTSLMSPEMKQQFDQAAGDVLRVPLYREVVAGPRFTISDLSGTERFLCGSFAFTHTTAGPARSALCLTSWRNKFVKLRLTAPGNSDASQNMRAFARAWMQILWPRS
jgi:hypothetical protein